MGNFLEDASWSVIFADCCDVESLWVRFSGILNVLIQMFVPRCVVSKKRIPANIRLLLRKKRKLYRTDKSLYKNACREYDAAVKAYYKQLELRVIYADSLSHFYKYVNRKSVHRCRLYVTKTPW